MTYIQGQGFAYHATVVLFNPLLPVLPFLQAKHNDADLQRILLVNTDHWTQDACIADYCFWYFCEMNYISSHIHKQSYSVILLIFSPCPDSECGGSNGILLHMLDDQCESGEVFWQLLTRDSKPFLLMRKSNCQVRRLLSFVFNLSHATFSHSNAPRLWSVISHLIFDKFS